MNKLEIIQIGKETKNKLNKFVLLLLLGILIELLVVGISAIEMFNRTGGSSAGGYSSDLFFSGNNELYLSRMGQFLIPIISLFIAGLYQVSHNYKSYLNLAATPKTYTISNTLIIVIASFILSISMLLIEMSVTGILETSDSLIILNSPKLFGFKWCMQDVFRNAVLSCITMSAVFMLGNMLSTKKNIFISAIIPVGLLASLFAILNAISLELNELAYNKNIQNLEWITIGIGLAFFILISVIDSIIMIKGAVKR